MVAANTAGGKTTFPSWSEPPPKLIEAAVNINIGAGASRSRRRSQSRRRQDIAVSNSTNNVAVLLRNAANNGFEPKIDLAVGSNPNSVAVGDFNQTANRIS